MNNFLVVANKRKDIDGVVANRIASFLKSHGKSCYICEDDIRKDSVRDRIPEDIDLVISIGGDGTFIGSARATRYNIPVLGVNMGTLGYLTEVEVDHVEQALLQVIEGNYLIEERMMIDGVIENDQQETALNEIVFSRKGVPRLLRFNVFVNGAFLNTYVADGIILSTPTGSTAYNLSAGGPIVEPTASMFVLTPICSHSLNTSSIVLSADDEIRIEMGARTYGETEEFVVSFDGRSTYDLVTGQAVTIRKSQNMTKLMKLRETSFLEILRRKMKGN